MKPVAAAIAVLAAVLATRPAAAQHATAQVTASATVVERIGVAAGASRVSGGRGGALEVTTALEVRGRAPRVVQVADGWEVRSIQAQEQGYAVRLRLPPRETADGRAAVHYVIATLN